MPRRVKKPSIVQRATSEPAIVYDSGSEEHAGDASSTSKEVENVGDGGPHVQVPRKPLHEESDILSSHSTNITTVSDSDMYSIPQSSPIASQSDGSSFGVDQTRTGLTETPTSTAVLCVADPPGQETTMHCGVTNDRSIAALAKTSASSPQQAQQQVISLDDVMRDEVDGGCRAENGTDLHQQLLDGANKAPASIGQAANVVKQRPAPPPPSSSSELPSTMTKITPAALPEPNTARTSTATVDETMSSSLTDSGLCFLTSSSQLENIQTEVAADVSIIVNKDTKRLIDQSTSIPSTITTVVAAGTHEMAQKVDMLPLAIPTQARKRGPQKLDATLLPPKLEPNAVKKDVEDDLNNLVSQQASSEGRSRNTDSPVLETKLDGNHKIQLTSGPSSISLTDPWLDTTIKVAPTLELSTPRKATLATVENQSSFGSASSSCRSQQTSPSKADDELRQMIRNLEAKVVALTEQRKVGPASSKIGQQQTRQRSPSPNNRREYLSQSTSKRSGSSLEQQQSSALSARLRDNFARSQSKGSMSSVDERTFQGPQASDNGLRQVVRELEVKVGALLEREQEQLEREHRFSRASSYRSKSPLRSSATGFSNQDRHCLARYPSKRSISRGSSSRSMTTSTAMPGAYAVAGGFRSLPHSPPPRGTARLHQMEQYLQDKVLDERHCEQQRTSRSPPRHTTSLSRSTSRRSLSETPFHLSRSHSRRSMSTSSSFNLSRSQSKRALSPGSPLGSVPGAIAVKGDGSFSTIHDNHNLSLQQMEGVLEAKVVALNQMQQKPQGRRRGPKGGYLRSQSSRSLTQSARGGSNLLRPHADRGLLRSLSSRSLPRSQSRRSLLPVHDSLQDAVYVVPDVHHHSLQRMEADIEAKAVRSKHSQHSMPTDSVRMSSLGGPKSNRDEPNSPRIGAVPNSGVAAPPPKHQPEGLAQQEPHMKLFRSHSTRSFSRHQPTREAPSHIQRHPGRGLPRSSASLPQLQCMHPSESFGDSPSQKHIVRGINGKVSRPNNFNNSTAAARLPVDRPSRNDSRDDSNSAQAAIKDVAPRNAQHQPESNNGSHSAITRRNGNSILPSGADAGDAKLPQEQHLLNYEVGGVERISEPCHSLDPNASTHCHNHREELVNSWLGGRGATEECQPREDEAIPAHEEQASEHDLDANHPHQHAYSMEQFDLDADTQSTSRNSPELNATCLEGINTVHSAMDSYIADLPPTMDFEHDEMDELSIGILEPDSPSQPATPPREVEGYQTSSTLSRLLLVRQTTDGPLTATAVTRDDLEQEVRQQIFSQAVTATHVAAVPDNLERQSSAASLGHISLDIDVSADVELKAMEAENSRILLEVQREKRWIICIVCGSIVMCTAIIGTVAGIRLSH